MAKQKKMKKGGKQLRSKVPDFRDLPPVIEWEQHFIPPLKRQPDKPLFGLGAFGFDLNLFQAIIITNLIVKQVRAGIKSVNANKTPNEPALAEWRGLLQTAVYDRLKAGGNWGTDGANVLAVAHDMGKIAGMISGGLLSAGPDHLKVAFLASKFHVTCSANGGVGGGAWCTFDWF